MKKKASIVTKAGLATSLLVAPLANMPIAKASSSNLNDWSNVAFVPYAKSDGTVMYDPANEPGISPDDVDFTSGLAKGSGDKASFYVYSDGSNLYFRMRMLGDPSDRKGGFLSSVWLVDIGINGVHKATVGVNGKSPHEDYIYVTDANGDNLKKISRTDGTGSHVPGTRVVEAENGQYFLDFQVPISSITEVVPDITANSIVQFYFATSKAANLAVVNKDGMGPNTGVSFTDAASVKLGQTISSLYIPTIAITSPSTFDPGAAVITGTTTNAQNGSAVEVAIGGSTYRTTVANGAWSVTTASLTAGPYVANAKVVNELGNMAVTKQNIEVGKSISIDGPAVRKVVSFPSTISGMFTNITGGSKKVKVTVRKPDGTSVYEKAGIIVDQGTQKWSQTGISLSLQPGTYTVEVVEDVMGSNNQVQNLPTAVQTIEILQPVVITSPVNNTSSPNATPTITGTAEPNVSVDVFIDGQKYGRVKSDSAGA